MDEHKEMILNVGLTKEDGTAFNECEIGSFFEEFIDLVEKYNFCAGGGMKPFVEDEIVGGLEGV